MTCNGVETKVLGEGFEIELIDRSNRQWTTLDYSVYYWSPSNITDTPTGTIAAGKITESGNKITITIDKDFITEESTDNSNYRFQVIDNITGAAWQPPTQVEIIKKGEV